MDSYTSSVLEFTDDMRRENVIALSLFQMTEFLKQDPSEISTSYRSGLLDTLAELCSEMEDPGDSFAYIKLLHLLVLVREYLTGDFRSDGDDEHSMHKKAQEIYTTVALLRNHLAGSMVACMDKMMAESQCQVVLSGIQSKNASSALHFWESFSSTSGSPFSRILSSQLKQVLDYVSSGTYDKDSHKEAKVKQLLFSQHSPRVLYDVVVAFFTANLPQLMERSPMFKRTQEYCRQHPMPQANCLNVEEENEKSSENLPAKVTGISEPADPKPVSVASLLLHHELDQGSDEEVATIDVEGFSDGQPEHNPIPPNIPDSTTSPKTVPSDTTPTDPDRATPSRALPDSHTESPEAASDLSNCRPSKIEKTLELTVSIPLGICSIKGNALHLNQNIKDENVCSVEANPGSASSKNLNFPPMSGRQSSSLHPASPDIFTSPVASRLRKRAEEIDGAAGDPTKKKKKGRKKKSKAPGSASPPALASSSAALPTALSTIPCQVQLHRSSKVLKVLLPQKDTASSSEPPHRKSAVQYKEQGNVPPVEMSGAPQQKVSGLERESPPKTSAGKLVANTGPSKSDSGKDTGPSKSDSGKEAARTLFGKPGRKKPGSDASHIHEPTRRPNQEPHHDGDSPVKALPPPPPPPPQHTSKQEKGGELKMVISQLKPGDRLSSQGTGHGISTGSKQEPTSVLKTVLGNSAEEKESKVTAHRKSKPGQEFKGTGSSKQSSSHRDQESVTCTKNGRSQSEHKSSNSAFSNKSSKQKGNSVATVKSSHPPAKKSSERTEKKRFDSEEVPDPPPPEQGLRDKNDSYVTEIADSLPEPHHDNASPLPLPPGLSPRRRSGRNIKSPERPKRVLEFSSCVVEVNISPGESPRERDIDSKQAPGRGRRSYEQQTDQDHKELDHSISPAPQPARSKKVTSHVVSVKKSNRQEYFSDHSASPEVLRPKRNQQASKADRVASPLHAREKGVKGMGQWEESDHSLSPIPRQSRKSSHSNPPPPPPPSSTERASRKRIRQESDHSISPLPAKRPEKSRTSGASPRLKTRQARRDEFVSDQELDRSVSPTPTRQHLKEQKTRNASMSRKTGRSTSVSSQEFDGRVEQTHAHTRQVEQRRERALGQRPKQIQMKHITHPSIKLSKAIITSSEEDLDCHHRRKMSEESSSEEDDREDRGNGEGVDDDYDDYDDYDDDDVGGGGGSYVKEHFNKQPSHDHDHDYDDDRNYDDDDDDDDDDGTRGGGGRTGHGGEGSSSSVYSGDGPSTSRSGIVRRVRRNEERKKTREVTAEVYDFSDEECTPASKLPERLPGLYFKSYKEFAPRGSRQASPVSRPTFRKPTYSKVRQGKGVKFSNEETDYLRAGIDKFGEGRWREILYYYPFHPSRTSTSLKDRARNMKGRIQ